MTLLYVQLGNAGLWVSGSTFSFIGLSASGIGSSLNMALYLSLLTDAQACDKVHKWNSV